jgi:hypothetical protein
MTASKAIPQAVLDAALALHQQKNTSLTYSPCSTSELSSVEGKQLWHCAENEISDALK